MFLILDNKNFLLKLIDHLRLVRRSYSSTRALILGIETSCDDTGCAVVDTEGSILGEALNSQHIIHLNNGGIIPPLAQDLHRKNIDLVAKEAVGCAGMRFEDLDAVAVTVKPGLPLSLDIGTRYAKYLCRKYHKPLIPIHHMEAHALTARLFDNTIEFPFLVLLISGGHCLLAVAKDVDKFYLLGESIDDAPGEAFDKMARRMKLRNLAEYSKLSGGQAIELAASKADNPLQFRFQMPLLQYKNCNFSFAGLKAQLHRIVVNQEKSKDLPVDAVIPDVNNLCAGFQLVITKHLCQRVQRGMEYAAKKGLIPPHRQTLVVAGGVACNNFIARGLQIVCHELEYKFVRPSPKFCTDNGVMIAWNGAERWRKGIGISQNIDDIQIEKTSPLGERLVEDVEKERISCKWVKLKELTSPQSVWMSN